jgi:hypothetical protein
VLQPQISHSVSQCVTCVPQGGGGRGAQAVGAECGMCDMHEVESEQHVLFHCPTYTDLRRSARIVWSPYYGVAGQAHAAMFTGGGADKKARFVRAVMCRHLQGAVDSHVTNHHMLVIWWLTAGGAWLTATIVLIPLWLTRFGPWTPTGSV